MKNFPHCFLKALRSRLGFQPSIVTEEVLNYRIRVREGVRGEYSDYDDAWAYALLTDSSVMFDVGCNVGFFTLLACLTNPARKIIAIDANAAALTITAENLFLNAISMQARFVLAFVSDTEDEEKTFFTIGTGAAGSMFESHAKTASAQGENFKVRTLTLDKIALEIGTMPDFVKIDIEGAEQFALRGAVKIAANRKTRFFVEMHSNKELSMKDNGDAVLSWCLKCGYSAYYLKEHRLVNTADPFSNRGRCHLLLQPQGWEYPPYLKRSNKVIL